MEAGGDALAISALASHVVLCTVFDTGHVHLHPHLIEVDGDSLTLLVSLNNEKSV